MVEGIAQILHGSRTQFAARVNQDCFPFDVQLFFGTLDEDNSTWQSEIAISTPQSRFAGAEILAGTIIQSELVM